MGEAPALCQNGHHRYIKALQGHELQTDGDEIPVNTFYPPLQGTKRKCLQRSKPVKPGVWLCICGLACTANRAILIYSIWFQATHNMPGQPWSSLALPLESICCLCDDVKRNLPLLLLRTWKLALTEGSERSIWFSALHTGLNSNANIILLNSDLIFHPPFPHFWISMSNEHLICSHHI